MQTDMYSTKSSEWLSKILEKIVVASGTIALVWILVFLLVAMIDK